MSNYYVGNRNEYHNTFIPKINSKYDLLEIRDYYNPQKVWLVKYTKDGNVYINQRNGKNLLNKGFVRTTRKFIKSLMESWEHDELLPQSELEYRADIWGL